LLRRPKVDVTVAVCQAITISFSIAEWAGIEDQTIPYQPEDSDLLLAFSTLFIWHRFPASFLQRIVQTDSIQAS
jgi:hypothetical protein